MVMCTTLGDPHPEWERMSVVFCAAGQILGGNPSRPDPTIPLALYSMALLAIAGAATSGRGRNRAMQEVGRRRDLHRPRTSSCVQLFEELQNFRRSRRIESSRAKRRVLSGCDLLK